MLLNIQKKSSSKKHRSLEPRNFDLYMGKTRVTGNSVSRDLFIQTIQKARQDWKTKEAEMSAKVKEFSESTPVEKEKEPVRFPGSTMIDSFEWSKDQNGKFVIDSESFTIRGEYLPEDDNAPDRLYDIAKDICNCFNAMYDQKLSHLDKAKEKTQHMPKGALNVSYEDNKIQKCTGEQQLEEVTRSLTKEEVILTIFWIQYRDQVVIAKNSVSDITVPATGCLPEMTFTVDQKGNLQVNTQKLNGEVLHIWEQMFPVLCPNK